MKLKELLPLVANYTTIDIYQQQKGRLCYAWTTEDEDLQPFLEKEIGEICASDEDILQIHLKNI